MKRSLALLAMLLALLATPAFAARATGAPAGRATAARPGAAVPLAAEKTTALVDLNSASKAELMKLPGVGEAISDRIIAGRPWKSKYDLVLKKVVTRSVYDRFAKLVVARQPKAR